MTKEYFEANVMMAVEVKYETGGRYWKTVKGSEFLAYIEEVDNDDCMCVSDVDYDTKQEDPQIQEFLEKAYNTWFHSDCVYSSLDELINSMFEVVEAPKRVWTEEEIKNLVQTNDKVLYGALKNLYACQTADEQQDAETRHANGAGFNALDAEFLTSVSQFLIRNGYLTDKQKACTRKKLVKYNKQLTRLANAC